MVLEDAAAAGSCHFEGIVGGIELRLDDIPQGMFGRFEKDRYLSEVETASMKMAGSWDEQHKDGLLKEWKRRTHEDEQWEAWISMES